MIQVGGYWWTPKGAKWCAAAVLRDSSDITRWLDKVPLRRECVQAGGNVGVYPKKLSESFERVYTFELDAENFSCLEANGMPVNVRAFRAALGEKSGTTGQRKDLPISHSVGGEGSIPMMRIDDLGLQQCDLIALDIEGYEWPALKGAEETLGRCHPVLIFEADHTERYGYTRNEMGLWLIQRGYRLVDWVNKDQVWR